MKKTPIFLSSYALQGLLKTYGIVPIDGDDGEFHGFNHFLNLFFIIRLYVLGRSALAMGCCS